MAKKTRVKQTQPSPRYVLAGNLAADRAAGRLLLEHGEHAGRCGRSGLVDAPPPNSYSPPFWYEDTVVQYKACARQFVFSKEEPRHWYEELRLPIYASAVRCPECRAQVRTMKASQREHMAKVAMKTPYPNEALGLDP